MHEVLHCLVKTQCTLLKLFVHMLQCRAATVQMAIIIPKYTCPLDCSYWHIKLKKALCLRSTKSITNVFSMTSLCVCWKIAWRQNRHLYTVSKYDLNCLISNPHRMCSFLGILKRLKWGNCFFKTKLDFVL